MQYVVQIDDIETAITKRGGHGCLLYTTHDPAITVEDIDRARLFSSRDEAEDEARRVGGRVFEVVR